MRPKLVAIKVSGGHLIPVIMRASSRGRRRRDFEASIIIRATIAVGPSRPGCTGPLSFAGAGADLAELVPDPLRGPGGLDGVGVAQVQQPAVGHAADVGPVDGSEGGQGLVPGGALVGGGRGGFGSDGVGGVVIAGQFQPGTDGGGALLPVEPVYRVLGYRAEGVDGPGQGRAR